MKIKTNRSLKKINLVHGSPHQGCQTLYSGLELALYVRQGPLRTESVGRTEIGAVLNALLELEKTPRTVDNMLSGFPATLI